MNECQCVNVEMGSHKAGVPVEIPPHMESYRKARVAAGLSDFITVDRCILPEVQHLWSLGIRTMGSCCGHRTHQPSISVHADDEVRMFKLGYEVIPPFREGGANTFASKTLAWPVKRRGIAVRFSDCWHRMMDRQWFRRTVLSALSPLFLALIFAECLHRAIADAAYGWRMAWRRNWTPFSNAWREDSSPPSFGPQPQGKPGIRKQRKEGE